jgi:putative oxidoreductase
VTSVGLDIGSAVLRLAIGGIMIVHGVRHGRTLVGTAGWFASIGFRQPLLQAKLSAVIEIGAGLALIIGLATPLAAAAVVGTMAVAGLVVHRQNGFFVMSDGYEYVLALALSSIALGALGPGRMSIDHAAGVDGHYVGVVGGLLAAVVGFGGAVGQLAVFWGRPVTAGSTDKSVSGL